MLCACARVDLQFYSHLFPITNMFSGTGWSRAGRAPLPSSSRGPLEAAVLYLCVTKSDTVPSCMARIFSSEGRKTPSFSNGDEPCPWPAQHHTNKQVRAPRAWLGMESRIHSLPRTVMVRNSPKEEGPDGSWDHEHHSRSTWLHQGDADSLRCDLAQKTPQRA